MYKCYTFIVIVLFFFCPNILNAQQQQWFWMSDFSPTSRMGNNQVLQSTSNLNLEWRNRVGMEIGNQLFLGLQGHVRKYENKEDYRQNFDFDGYGDFVYKISNTNWGIGPFLTQVFEPGRKLQIQTTLFASLEQGSGNYRVDQTDFVCPVCMTNFIVIPMPFEIENIDFRERNFFAGLEMAVLYRLTPKLSATGSINLFQYENFRRTSSQDLVELDPVLERPLLRSGSGFTHFIERPMVYLGIKMKLR